MILHPIYGVWHIPFWQTRWFLILAVVLFVVLVGLVVWFVAQKLRTPKKQKKSAHDVAFAELDAIEKQLSSQGMLGKTFYFRLTWVFKRYLSDRYGFDVYGKTDQELLNFVENGGLNPDRVQDLSVIFEGSSQIKFANEQALKERMLNDLALSRKFIYKTMPHEKKET